MSRTDCFGTFTPLHAASHNRLRWLLSTAVPVWQLCGKQANSPRLKGTQQLPPAPVPRDLRFATLSASELPKSDRHYRWGGDAYASMPYNHCSHTRTGAYLWVFAAVECALHVSRLYIANYRSIRELDLRFDKGKNVIIGRNNCGKSNIIKALHIVLGETSPTYQKSENISLGDFHSWKEKQGDDLVSRSANELFIWCELSREAGEALDYDALYKCFGFHVACDEYRHHLRFRTATLPENFAQIFDLTEGTVAWRQYVNHCERRRV